MLFRSLRDGQVEVLAQGTEAQLSTLEGRLWGGPPHARVAAVVVEATDEHPAREFRVLPTPW